MVRSTAWTTIGESALLCPKSDSGKRQRPNSDTRSLEDHHRASLKIVFDAIEVGKK